ncbi:MAG: VOC family protein, partial [Candidatus Eremiobacteraeota bacterium]|nr:VOC family protein [Candidatus Eremiobacteraeota bacterium]
SMTRSGPADFEWLGFTEDVNASPNKNRIAFVATSNDDVEHVAAILREIGADVEGPNYDEGPGYYAVFFADPDGNLLEVCCRTQ